MDFSWTEKQRAFRQSVARFAQRELNGDVAGRDQKAEFFWEGWRRCAEFGIHGLPLPAEYGGSNAAVLTTMLAMEALGYGCRDNGLLFSINAHMWSCQAPILAFGTEEQRRTYLPRLARGELVGAGLLGVANC